MKRDRFREAVGGLAFAALLSLGILVAGAWGQQDMGIDPFEQVR